ncbi:hypothetical protein HY837_01585 [archaeon]|nr:hypothetical protein [archaeon]
MSLKKALGVSSFVLLSSCAPQPKLPEFPQMSFEEKITHHTNDGELSYFEAKDLMKAYEKEQKKGNSEGEQMQLRELSEKLKDELCKEYLLLGESDYYGMYNIKEEISEKYNDQIKNLMLCFDKYRFRGLSR